MLLYMNLMATTNQKSVIDTQKIMRKESKHNTIESHQTTRKERKRRRKNREEPLTHPERM